MSVRRIPIRTAQILHQEGVFELINSTLHYFNGFSAPTSIHKIIHNYQHYQHPLKYTSANPFKILKVDPKKVQTFQSLPTEQDVPDHRVVFDSKGRFHKWENVGYVVDGEWDLNTTLEFQFEKSARQHFIHDAPWSDTEYFNDKMELIENGGVWRGRKTKSEVKKVFKKWDQLYQSIKKDGYQRSLPKGLFRWQKNFDELTVCIGRDGRLIRSSSGSHRICIARILDIDSIPARVLIRHRNWELKRRSLNSYSKLTEDVTHPDMVEFNNGCKC